MKLSAFIADKARVESLDFLRGAAVLVIFLTHFEILDLKGVAVDLFFVLSGMLVTKSLLRSHSESGQYSLKAFVIKRAAKILPAYYFFLLAGYLIGIFFISGISRDDVPLLREMPQYLFFFRNYSGPPPRWTMEHTWSLCVEEHFYLILTIAFFIIYKLYQDVKKKLFILALLLIAAGAFFKIQALFTGIAEWPTYTHNRLDAFGWGMLLYFIVFEKWTVYQKVRLIDNKVVAIVGLLLLMLTVLFDKSLNELLLRTLSPFFWGLVILGIYNLKVPMVVIFKILAYFSYTIYLWHFLFVIPAIYYFGHTFQGFLVYTLLTFSFAALSTLLVEEKSIAFGRAVIKRIRPSLSKLSFSNSKQ